MFTKHNILSISVLALFIVSSSLKASTYELAENLSGPSTYTLTAVKSGTGTGLINGIDAATTTFMFGETFTLTATANPGSTFTGWSGDCIGTASCLLVMSGNKSITTTFTANNVVTPPGTAGGGGGASGGGNTSGGGSNTSGATNTGGYTNPNNTGLGINTNLNVTPIKYSFVQTLGVTQKSDDVIKLQQLLNANGYTVAFSGIGSRGQESNYFGPATRAALIKFQTAKKIPTTGVLDLATRTALNEFNMPITPEANTLVNATGGYAFVRNLMVNSRDSDVIKLQQILNAKGYIIATRGAGSPGLESNYFGPATRAALARFQRDNGISPAAGFLGVITRAKLSK